MRERDGAGSCAGGRGLQDAIGVAVSPDGSVYVASIRVTPVARFMRAP